MTAAELDPEEASKAVAYAQKKVDRAKNFITNMKGKERVALGELRQALEFATMGGADEAMLAEIRELSQSIQEGMEGPNENTNKNTALRARGATAKAAPVARAQTLCDQVFHRPDIVSKVMKFLGWEQRFEMMVLNRHMIETTILNDGHWKWMCSRLDECGLYAPNGIPAGTTWKALFEEIYPMRKLFDEPPAAPFETETVRNLRLLREGREEEIQEPGEESEVGAAEATSKPDYKFNIQVCARMRPAPPGTHDSTKVGGGDQGVAMVLPLHQRLKLIQASHKCSKKEARRILWEGRGSNDPWATARCLEEEELREAAAAAAAAAAAEGGEEGPDRVGVNAGGVQASVLSVEGGRGGNVLMVGPGAGLREFSFDNVVSESGAQGDVYEGSVRRLVVDFLNGSNGCVLAYGQTGSGKTHTMFGPDAATGSAVRDPHPDRSGIVPRACAEVMRVLEGKFRQGTVAALRASYVEVYGDAVTDLLGDGAAVGMWQGVAHRALFTGMCSVPVGDAGELEGMLLKADAAKRRAATMMNERSSRAHSVLLLSLLQTRADTGAEVTSTMCFADLGGSEQVFKSDVAEMHTREAGFLQKETRMQEAVNINLGLSALKACIKSLVEKTYVPYQNSRLTMMLSSALGGNCRTCVVVTGSSEKRHAVETMQALRFGEACSLVTNDASRDSMAAVTRALKAIDAEIERVEAAIVAKEKWETVRTVRRDDLHQEGEATCGEEVVVTSKLVGAEVEREHLELLLSRRRVLTGV